jgi:hypothetical protein
VSINKEYWVVAVDKQANVNDFITFYEDDEWAAEAEALRLNETETNWNLKYEVWCIPLDE